MSSFGAVARRAVAALAAVACTGLMIAVPSDTGYGWRKNEVAQQTASYAKTQRVYTLFGDDGRPGEWIVGNSFNVTAAGTIVDYDDSAGGHPTIIDAAQAGPASSQSVLPAGSKALPWAVHITYSLNGPDADRSAVQGADGLVGVRIRLEANPLSDTRYFRDAMPIVTFTIPHDVTDNVAVPDTAVVTDDGDSYRISAVGVAGRTNEWDCFMNAKAFRMGRLVIAAVPADRTDDGRDADQSVMRDRLAALASGANALSGGMTNAGSGEHQALIDQLSAMRDQEKAAVDAEIAAKHDAYVKQFGIYIDRYVRSYSSHISGQPGTKTQMGALIGMTGELTGDTPLSQSVTDLANAVNAMSDAHGHTGAANIIDEVIRQIQRRGTTGLLADLKTRQAKEANTGKSRYSAGQGQLANAMIPFSMAYTDTYTARLNDLVNQGGSVAGSEQTAIDQTNQAFGSDEDMQKYTGQISAALKTMAGAREHTGAADMLGTIIDRFGAQMENSGAGDSDGAGASAAASAGASAGAADDSVGGGAVFHSGSVGVDAPFAMIGAASGPIEPADETTALHAGEGTVIDQSATIGDASTDLGAAIDALMPADKAASDSVLRAISSSAASVRYGDGGGDVISPDNTHTVSADFLMVLPAVGDADSIGAASASDGDAASQIPGLGAIVGKFMG